MLNDIIILLLGYAVASFVLTALFVRLGKQTGLAIKIRQRFYWFPFIPPVLFVQGFLQIVAWASRSLISLLRYCFESLSGKKTYRRQRIDRYYYD